MKEKNEELFDDPYSEKLGEPHSVVNGDLFIGQAYNGHIQVYDKNTGDMVMHISCTKMLSDDEMVETVFKMLEVAERAHV